MKNKSFVIRQTWSWSYSIDKYENWEFIWTISQNNLFNLSHEKELNEFSENIVNSFFEKNQENIEDDYFIEELRNTYEFNYWVIEEFWIDDDDHLKNEKIETILEEDLEKLWIEFINWYKEWFNRVKEKFWFIIKDNKVEIWMSSFLKLSEKYFDKNINQKFCIQLKDWKIDSFNEKDKNFFCEWLSLQWKEKDFIENYFHWIIEWIAFEWNYIEDIQKVSNSKKIFWLKDQTVYFNLMKKYIF